MRAILVNTGNANAGTGADGLARARSTCAALAGLLGCAPEQVLPFSTGVIMETLPNDRIEAGAAGGARRCAARPLGRRGRGDHDHRHRAQGGVAHACSSAASTVTVTGISKGAGMIRPNMATMLGFVATDAAIEPALMQQLVREAADESFNRITIDGDTSTNDSFVLIATHRAGNAPVTSLDSGDGRALRDAVVEVSRRLAQAIVRDGEGRDQVHHRPRRRRRERRRVPPGRLRDRPLAAGEDGVLRQRSRTSAASSPRSATPASTTSTRPGSTSSSTTSTSSKAAAAGRAIARKTASA